MFSSRLFDCHSRSINLKNYSTRLSCLRSSPHLNRNLIYYLNLPVYNAGVSLPAEPHVEVFPIVVGDTSLVPLLLHIIFVISPWMILIVSSTKPSSRSSSQGTTSSSAPYVIVSTTSGLKILHNLFFEGIFLLDFFIIFLLV